MPFSFFPFSVCLFKEIGGRGGGGGGEKEEGEEEKRITFWK